MWKNISFVTMNGMSIPIHEDGNCPGSTGAASYGWRYSLSNYSSESFCWRTTCPIRGCYPVYFVRHNGGSVWFNHLGQPWPKHSCFVELEIRNELLDLQAIAQGLPDGVLLGWVVIVIPAPSRMKSFYPTLSYSLAAIACADNKGRCVELRGKCTGLEKAMVLLNLNSTEPSLRLISGETYQIVESHDPTKIGFTREWTENCLKVRGNILQPKFRRKFLSYDSY
jgi:hypothetical protein